MSPGEWITVNFKSLTIAVYAVYLYWVKELMEYFLRVIYGVDRRMMYVPVAQNVRAELALLGNVRQYQRGELFYYVYHSLISICIGIVTFIAARTTLGT